MKDGKSDIMGRILHPPTVVVSQQMGALILPRVTFTMFS